MKKHNSLSGIAVNDSFPHLGLAKHFSQQVTTIHYKWLQKDLIACDDGQNVG